MTEIRECPECGSYDTESVYQEFEDDIALQVRICNDCPTEYEVRWGKLQLGTDKRNHEYEDPSMTEELKINAIPLSDEQIQAILGEEIIVYDSDKETDGRIDVVLHEDQEQHLIGLVDDLREKIRRRGRSDE